MCHFPPRHHLSMLFLTIIIAYFCSLRSWNGHKLIAARCDQPLFSAQHPNRRISVSPLAHCSAYNFRQNATPHIIAGWCKMIPRLCVKYSRTTKWYYFAHKKEPPRLRQLWVYDLILGSSLAALSFLRANGQLDWSEIPDTLLRQQQYHTHLPASPSASRRCR